MFSAADWDEDVHQLNYGWAYGYENQGGHHKQDERDDHFNGGLGGLLFGALAALGAQGIGMDAQGLGYAGSEAVGLNQGSDQRANVVYAGARRLDFAALRRAVCRRGFPGRRDGIRRSVRGAQWRRSSPTRIMA